LRETLRFLGVRYPWRLLIAGVGGSHEGSSVVEGNIRQKIHHDSNLIRVAQIALSDSLIGNSRGSVSSRLTSVVNCSGSCFAKASQIFSASSYSFRASAILFWSLSRCHLHLIRSAAQDGVPRAAQLNAKKFCS
jgi:hypothetical protein